MSLQRTYKPAESNRIQVSSFQEKAPHDAGLELDYLMFRMGIRHLLEHMVGQIVFLPLPPLPHVLRKYVILHAKRGFVAVIKDLPQPVFFLLVFIFY